MPNCENTSRKQQFCTFLLKRSFLKINEPKPLILQLAYISGRLALVILFKKLSQVRGYHPHQASLVFTHVTWCESDQSQLHVSDRDMTNNSKRWQLRQQNRHCRRVPSCRVTTQGKRTSPLSTRHLDLCPILCRVPNNTVKQNPLSPPSRCISWWRGGTMW